MKKDIITDELIGHFHCRLTGDSILYRADKDVLSSNVDVNDL